MAKLAALIMVLATVALQSDAEVKIPFPSDNLVPSLGLNSYCTVKNETFVGWFKVDGNVKIDIVASRSDVKDKPAVYVQTVNAYEKSCILIFPKGTPASAGGRYKCKGDKNEAFLDVYVSFSLDALQRTQSLHVGKAGKIVLGALAYPLAKFKWKKDNVDIDFASESRLTLETDGSISISNVQESDAGTYDVNINWDGGRAIVDEKMTVNVIEKPRFLSTPTPSKLTGVLGFDYQFCCNHTGLPKPTLKWYKVQGVNEVEVDVTNPRYSVDKNCMSIKTLQKSDAATYKCTSTNSAGSSSASVSMEKVGVKPTVVAFAQDSLIKSVNKPLEIECNGQGDPLPTMQWTKGGKVVAGQTQEPGRSTMKFSKLRLEDTANYTCTAKNGLIYKSKELSDSRDVQLNVIAKPLVNSQATTTTVYSFIGNRNSVLIRCVFDGFPEPFVEIVKDGVQLDNDTSKAFISLITTKNEQFGDYVCNAKNLHGSASHTVNLVRATVPGKPINVQANKTCNSISLSWEPPSNNGGMMILHYIIAAKTATAKYRQRNVNEDKRTHKIEHVFKPEITYTVEVYARNGVGNGDPEIVKVTTDKYCKPSPPLITTIGGKRTRPDLTVFGPNIKVTWREPKYNGFDENLRYNVEWRAKKVSEETKWEKSDEVENKEYEIKGLKKGRYEIKVFGINQAGKGNPDMRVVNVEIRSDLPVSSATATSSPTPPTPASATTSHFIKAIETDAEMPTHPHGMSRNDTTQDPPVASKGTGGLSKGIIAGIVIAILLIVLITIDLFCCFFNSCGVIFCCQRACCGGKYSPNGKAKKDAAEMEKLKKDPAPANV